MGRSLPGAVVGLLAVASFVAWSPATARAESDSTRKPSVEEIVTHFTAATFGGGIDGALRDRRLFKWENPLQVRLAGAAPARYRAWVEGHMARLGALTGLTIEMVETIDAELLIYFVPSFDDVLSGTYNTLFSHYVGSAAQVSALLAGYRAAGAVCIGQVTARDHVLAEALVFIPIDQSPPVIHSCIAAQTSRALGILYALEATAPSVFAADSPHSHLTPLDEAIIGLLYNEKIKPGMTREAATAAARQILAAK